MNKIIFQNGSSWIDESCRRLLECCNEIKCKITRPFSSNQLHLGYFPRFWKDVIHDSTRWWGWLGGMNKPCKGKICWNIWREKRIHAQCTISNQIYRQHCSAPLCLCHHVWQKSKTMANLPINKICSFYLLETMLQHRPGNFDIPI